MTKINGLSNILDVLRHLLQMVKTSCKLALAAIVLGVVNQACAVTSEPQRAGSADTPSSPAPSATPVASRPVPAMPKSALPGSASEPLSQGGTTPARSDARAGVPAQSENSRLRVSVDLNRPATAMPAATAGAPQPQKLPDASLASRSTGSPTAVESSPPPLPSADVGAPSQNRESAPPAPSAGSGPTAFDGLPGAPATPSVASKDGKSYGNLWDRLRAGFTMPNVDSPLVDRHVEWYVNRPEYVQRLVDRGRRYMHFIVEEVEKRGMPLEIALLPMIESAYNPAAYSKAHAAGMWQFIPTTGRNYGLQQNWWYDGRRDVTAATRAALDYLQKLYGDFGDWQLALAAYNWGEGAVSRAIAHNQRSGLPSDYSNLKMPAETRNYLPKLQAVKNLVAEPERYGLALDDVPNEPYFIRVAAPGHIDFKRAAQLAETPLDEFKSLNPAYNRPVIASDGEQSLLIPAEKIDAFNANLKSSEAPLLSWQTYRLTKHERIEAVAQRFHTSASLLRQVNGIASQGRLKAGSTLLVPRETGLSTKSPDELDTLRFLPPQMLAEKRFHRAQRGDTLPSIAAQYGLSTEQIMSWNRLKGGKLRPGQRVALVAPSPVKVVRAPRGRAMIATSAVPPTKSRGPQHQAGNKVQPKKNPVKSARGRCCNSPPKSAHIARR